MTFLLKFILFITSLILAGLISLVLIFFFNPTFIITPKTIDFILSKTSILKSWSWSEGAINHRWVKWNYRQFSGSFKDLCIVYQTSTMNIDSCMEKIAWNLDLSWNLEKGFNYLIERPLVVESKKTDITLFPGVNKKSDRPDYFELWKLLWNGLIPDLDFTFNQISINRPKEKKISFDLALLKTREVLNVYTVGYEFIGKENEIVIKAPQNIFLPMDLKTKSPLRFNDLTLTALLKDTNVPITIRGRLERARLNIDMNISKKWLQEDIPLYELEKRILLSAQGHLKVLKLKATVKELFKPPFNILPAPLNAMEGDLNIDVKTSDPGERENIIFNIKAALDLSGEKQVLNMNLINDLPINLKTRGLGTITVGIEFKKVALLLPKMAKNKMPPQLKPDSRFFSAKKLAAKKRKKKKMDFNMHFQALGTKAVFIKSNLLDEALGLNFDLFLEDKKITEGFVQTLPLKTTFFKRPIFVKSARINFNDPLEPEIIALVEFHLPLYFITLNLEGPISRPRQAFSSNPPLSQDDIYAVLLFGKPLNALATDDKTAAQSAGKILSEGILSLAVLYYFAGSPIESLGYDPESKALAAQVGVGSKSSLRVSSQSGQFNSAGIRRSLGKGWYIDTSVEKASGQNMPRGTSDYGVLLEKIISY